ncbi:MAG: hypothetical protein ACTSSH_09585 [Candidatus Heimdallarchaeota archaeon]
MKKRRLEIPDIFRLRSKENYNSFQDTKFQEALIHEDSDDYKENSSFICKTKRFLKKIWRAPESRVIILLLLSRLIFVIFTSWGIDFDFYIEISKRYLAGEKLYVDIDSTHMPLVDFIYIFMYYICPWKGNIYAVRVFLKFPFILTDIGIALAVMKIIEKEFLRKNDNEQVIKEILYEKIRRAKMVGGYFIALSIPLILQTGGGRYDSLMIFCFVMVVLCLQKNNWFGVAFFAALGSSAKYIGIIFLPFVILWMKKDDILPFVIGLILGFVPIIPFLITIPDVFIDAILLRSSHIAYGFSIWHGIFIIWNKFNMKYVDGIESTYDSGGEPWFVQKLYLPMFIAIYTTVFVLYIIKYRKAIRTQNIDSLPITRLLSLVFIPLFIFALSFKAINIQVLAWFVPYIALRKRKGLLIEYTLLTIIHGLALLIFEASNPEIFLKLSENAALVDSPFYHMVVIPALHLIEVIDKVVWVSIIFVTILWFFIRTSFEFGKLTKELLTKEYTPFPV